MLIDFSYIEDVILPISRKIIEGNPKRLHPAGVLIPVAKGKKQVTAFPLAGGATPLFGGRPSLNWQMISIPNGILFSSKGRRSLILC